MSSGWASVSDYQGHAAGDQTAKRQPWRTHLEQPSALAALDLGCGEATRA